VSDTNESSGGLATRSTFGDRPPLRPGQAATAVARSVLKAAVLLTQRRVHQPTVHVGDVLGFADGTSASVYRETVIRRAKTLDPAVLMVAFRLRWVRGRWHAAFRAESLLNTPLFVGFEGLVSKLWLSHDELGRYRGLYEWDGPALADSYARALWWVLWLVCEPGTIHYTVVPGRQRDDVLNNPGVLGPSGTIPPEWWRLDRVESPPRQPEIASSREGARNTRS
jgi:hypothetical protein